MSDLTLKQYMELQREEILGATNRYYYWLETGRNSEEATHSELAQFYINHGGHNHFRETHRRDNESQTTL